MELSHDEILVCLSIAKELRQSMRLYDMHVHPYEVIYDGFVYADDATLGGVMNLAGKSYRTPSLTTFTLPEILGGRIAMEPSRRRQISLIQLSTVYGSVGERVIADQMELSCVDRVLLLPVASDAGDFAGRMDWVKQLYGNGERFLLGGSVPGALDKSDFLPYLAALKQDFGVGAIKCHPVVSGIDLGSSRGREWLETLLAACHASGLPLVLHGGRNNPYWEGARGDYGALEHLQTINWSISQEPVVLAHAGCHRCPLHEMEQELLPMLGKMLDAHPNLYIDTSGLGFEALKLVLRYVAGERILFGSDALYVPQWGAMAMTMHALKEMGMAVDAYFAGMASINPGKTIFKDA